MEKMTKLVEANLTETQQQQNQWCDSTAHELYKERSTSLTAHNV